MGSGQITRRAHTFAGRARTSGAELRWARRSTPALRRLLRAAAAASSRSRTCCRASGREVPGCDRRTWFQRTSVIAIYLGGSVVSVLDSGAEGPGFKSQPRRCRVTVLGKLFTPVVPLFTKQQVM